MYIATWCTSIYYKVYTCTESYLQGWQKKGNLILNVQIVAWEYIIRT